MSYYSDRNELVILGQAGFFTDYSNRMYRINASTGATIDTQEVSLPYSEVTVDLGGNLILLGSLENNGTTKATSPGAIARFNPLDGTLLTGALPTVENRDRSNVRRSTATLENGDLLVATTSVNDPSQRVVAATLSPRDVPSDPAFGVTITESEAVGALISSGVDVSAATFIARDLGPIVVRHEVPAGMSFYRYDVRNRQIDSFHRSNSASDSVSNILGAGPGIDADYIGAVGERIRRTTTSPMTVLTGLEGRGGPIEVLSGDAPFKGDSEAFTHRTRIIDLTAELLTRSAGGPAGSPNRLSAETARDLAYFCLEQEAPLGADTESECSGEVNILSHGPGLGEATLLRYQSIDDNPVNAVNNFQNTVEYSALLAADTDGEGRIPARSWYDMFEPCSFSVGLRMEAAIDCDEFPNYRSLQNLQRNGEGPDSKGLVFTGAIDASTNRSEGGFYSAFISGSSARGCGIPSAYDLEQGTLDVEANPASEFVVVARPDTEATGIVDPVVWLCAGEPG